MKRNPFTNRTYASANHLGLLLLLALLCYWPLSFGIFSAKNDNIVQFLPVRFQVSEALRHGYVPLWSPYMYLGYPVHGDMQGGAWNPVVWLLSAFGRYNVTSVHAEIIIYIFLGGTGMYRLLGTSGIRPGLRLAGAAAYLMCGYITDVGGSNLPFLAAGAYIPFVFAYFYGLLSAWSWRYAIKTAAALALLFVSGYPSFFITVCYILLAAWLIFLIRNYRTHRKFLSKWQMRRLFGLALLFLGLCAPAILSYVEILPYYARGGGVGLEGALHNSFHPSCSLSFLLPSVPVKNSASFTTDLISRNGYFNSFFLLFALCYAGAKKRLYLNFAAIGLLFFFLFSLGGATPLRAWCYKLLPLMNTFRHPSNARLFVTVCGIVLGAHVCQQWLLGSVKKNWPVWIGAVLMACIAIGLFTWSRPNDFFQKIQELGSSHGNWRANLKSFFDGLSMSDVVLINGVLQLIFLGVFILMRRQRTKALIFLFIANSFVFAQLSIPYTLVSQVPPRALNALLRTYPAGYPLPDPNKSLAENSVHALDHFDTLGITAFYQKQIAVTNVAFTPTFLEPFEQLYADSNALKRTLRNPYAYTPDSINFHTENGKRDVLIPKAPRGYSWLAVSGKGSMELKKIWNNGFRFSTSSDSLMALCLQQVYLPGWECYVDGERAPLAPVNKIFMATAVPRGKHEVVFEYRPVGIAAALALSLICWLFIFIILKWKGSEKARQSE